MIRKTLTIVSFLGLLLSVGLNCSSEPVDLAELGCLVEEDTLQRLRGVYGNGEDFYDFDSMREVAPGLACGQCVDADILFLAEGGHTPFNFYFHSPSGEFFALYQFIDGGSSCALHAWEMYWPLRVDCQIPTEITKCRDFKR